MPSFSPRNNSVYTEYSVVVSAFNKIGQGPKSPEVRAFTKEGKPQMPPQVSLSRLL